jgi:hypothetical protein
MGRIIFLILLVFIAIRVLAVVAVGIGVFNLSAESVLGAVLVGVLSRPLGLAVVVGGLLYAAGWYVRGMVPAQTLEGTAEAAELGLDRLPPPQLGEIEALRREEAEARRLGSDRAESG